MSKQCERDRLLPTRGRCGLALVAAGILAALLAACNTTEGVGKDIKSAGEGIEDTARDAKN